MKKFKLEWRERVEDSEGSLLHYVIKHQVIEAESEDAACDQWEAEYEHNEAQNGLNSCVEVVEHPLLDKHLHLEMPNGCCYAIPVEFIVRRHAQLHAQEQFDGDAGKSLIEGTLPLFEADEEKLKAWAATHLKWRDVSAVAKVYQKKISDTEFEKTWQQANFSMA